MKNKTGLKTGKVKDNLHIFINAAAACVRHISFEKLTVRDIVERAGLSRQTFYRCCSSKYDLVNQYIGQLMHDCYVEAESMRQMDLFPENFIKALQKQKRLIASACLSEDYNNPMNYLNRILYEHYLSHIPGGGQGMSQYQEDLLDSYCESFVYILKKWLSDEIDASPGEVADRILDVMPVKLKKNLLF